MIYAHVKVQCVPKKKVLIECCWSHSAPVQSPVAGTLRTGKCFVCSFLTKTKQDKALPRYFNGKIWPHNTQFWLCFSIGTFFGGHPVLLHKLRYGFYWASLSTM